jgi:hypothetical protein
LATTFLQALDKLMRGMRLYEGEGPLVQRLLDLAASACGALLAHGDVTFRVAPFGLLLDGDRVTDENDPLSKSMFRFFCDGIRELTLLQGLDNSELVRFATVLRTEPKAGEDDMTTLLWKQEFSHLRFYATDTFQASVNEGEAHAFALAGAGAASLGRHGQGSHEAALSPDDLRMLRDDESLAWVRRCAAPLSPPRSLQEKIEAVRLQFQEPPDFEGLVGLALAQPPARGGGANALLTAAFDALISEGDTDSIVALVDAVSTAGASGTSLLTALLSPDRLARIAPLYERQFERLSASLESASRGREEALVPLLNALTSGPAETRLREALEGRVELSSFYARRMTSDDPDVIVGAIGALAAGGSPDAYEAISRALTATLTRVRHAALDAMVGHYVPDARLALERALRDPDRENRLLALRILEGSGDPPVARSILAMVQDVGAGEDEELRAAFKALSRFRNPRIVEYLGTVLADRNLTRSRSVQTRQLLAVNALREIGTPEALGSLEVAGGFWHLSRPVKDAIGTALRRRSEDPK